MSAYVVNWAGVDDDPLEHVLTIAANPSSATDAAQGGFVMSKDFELYCTASSPGVFDLFNDGIAISPADSMRVLMCATEDGPPADAFWVHGLPVSTTGQLCLTTDVAPDHWIGGWPVDIGGLVITGESIEVVLLLLETGDLLLLENGDFFEEE